jgi:hypothetical protein
VTGLELLFDELNGPEPTASVICWNGSVLASLSGMMKGGMLDTLASPSSNRPNGSFNLITNALSPSGLISSSTAFTAWPWPSRAIQRFSEATQSAPRTGLPS